MTKLTMSEKNLHQNYVVNIALCYKKEIYKMVTE